MDCPACNGALKTITLEDREIDTCPSCGGIWFDRDELVAIVDSLLDDGNVAPRSAKEIYRGKIIGIADDEQLRRTCPRCGVRMYLQNCRHDTNIFLDRCPECDGIWTDKGELRAIEKHLRKNPPEDLSAKAVLLACARRTATGICTHKVLAVLLSASYLVAGYRHNGIRAVFGVLFALILPLTCIMYGEEMGCVTGVRFRPTIFAPLITKESPGVLVVFMGWVLLLLPLVVLILSWTGAYTP